MLKMKIEKEIEGEEVYIRFNPPKNKFEFIKWMEEIKLIKKEGKKRKKK